MVTFPSITTLDHKKGISFFTPVLIALLFIFPSELFSQSYWSQKGGGATIDEAADISVDANGNTYSTGYFTSSASFGTFNLSSSGSTDIFLCKLNSQGIYQWAVKAGGTGSDRAVSIKTDAQGNSYITGYYFGTATFGLQTITSAGNQDVFIAKYDNTGALLWVKSAGGPASDIGNGINVDNNGNVVVTGEFTGTSAFGLTNLTSMNSSVDVFTTKLNSSGTFQWAKKGSASQTDRGLDVACDNAGNVYITGQFSDTITFDVTHNNNLFNAIFLVKYNSAGVEQWFQKAGSGTSNVSTGIAVDNNANIFITGNFTGTLIFFGTTNTNLTNTYPNRIFTAKYDVNGTLLWAEADGSLSDISSNNIALSATGDPYVVGNFKCRLNQYADQYGQGTFNTVGYWDIFVTKYNSSGTWQWSRQFGGKQQNLGTGIAVDASDEPYVSGSFDQDMIIPVNPNFWGYSTFTAYQMTLHNNVANSFLTYCNDNNYGLFAGHVSSGNFDAFIAKPCDLNRAPYDYYHRTGTGCNRPVDSVCINVSPADNSCGPDSLNVCGNVNIFAISNTSNYGPNNINSVGPDFTYLWSTGATTNYLFVTTTGTYAVTLTSADGCFVSTDSVYVKVNPIPPKPRITDDHGFNLNAVSPVPVVMCFPDSALLTATGLPNPGGVSWTGPSGTSNTPTIYASLSGLYYVTVTDANGCTNTNSVLVQIDTTITHILPVMVCLTDTDRNDTIELCDDHAFVMYIYDSLTNPTGVLDCIPYSTIYWSVTPNTITYNTQTYCNNNTYTWNLTFNPNQTGWYNVTAMLVQTNLCDTDTVYVTKPIYVIIYPVPTASASVTIGGNSHLCPGDSALLVATAIGASYYSWYGPNNFSSTNDSIKVAQPGVYFVIVTDTVTNQYGCYAVAVDTAFVSVNVNQQPILTINPISGLICPGDSVQLSVTGTGSFQWIGPSGPVGSNTNVIYVSDPGQYYCVNTDPDSCQLVSNTVTLTLYATPYLLASPSGVICFGDTLTITAMSADTNNIQWLAPLAGNSSTQFITSPGTYSAMIVACGIPTMVSITVVASGVTAQITALTDTVCAGDTITLTGNSGMDNYLWNPGSVVGQTLNATFTGTYFLTTSDTGGCTARDSITIFFTPNTLTPPTVIDTSICIGTSVTLFANGMPTIEWYSSSNGGSLLTTGNSYTTPAIWNDQTYYMLTHSGLCRSSYDSLTVHPIECPIDVPNVFTPNGDGVNDVFNFNTEGMKSLHCRIYNRWGNLIYEWATVLSGWDGTNMHTGKIVSDGVYYYIADITDQYDVTQQLHGFIQVLWNK